MNQKNQFKFIFLSLIIIVILIIASNFLLYNKLTSDYNAKVQVLKDELEDTKDALVTAINNEREFSAQQRKVLEEKTLSNFQKLQDFFSTETSRLKLDLETVKSQTESDIKGISENVKDLTEKNEDLASQIADIDVQSSDFSAIVDDVIKAVVSVKTNKGQGSGVIFNEQGYIMTNKHVIEGITNVYVVDYDNNRHDVQIVGAAQNADIAVLKVLTGDNFDYLSFADSSDIKVGERVIAVGNPLGLSFSVTEGIISATNRVIDSSGVPYIQTDVSINAGNSGGPLVNSKKKIVGINTFKILDTEGLGFAIPSSVASGIAEQAIS